MRKARLNSQGYQQLLRVVWFLLAFLTAVQANSSSFSRITLDTFLDPDEAIDHPELTHDDLRHHPFAYSSGYVTFAGLQLSAFVHSGVVVSTEERPAVKPTATSLLPPRAPLAPRDLLPSLLHGDRDGLPVSSNSRNSSTGCSSSSLTFMQITDFFFPVQMEGSPFRNAFCAHFVELMHLKDRAPLVVALHTWAVSSFALQCLFLRSDELKLATRRFVLLSAQGDSTAGSTFFNNRELLLPYKRDVHLVYLLTHPLLTHWYGVNGNIHHHKFTSLPMGLPLFYSSGQSLFPSKNSDRSLPTITASPSLGNQNDGERRFRRRRHPPPSYAQRLLEGLDLHGVFPQLTNLTLGKRKPLPLEIALDMLLGQTLDPPVKWVKLEELPGRVTTIYVVLMPLERRREDRQYSLTSDVMVIEPEEGNAATMASQHIALLPFTAALYHKLLQHPYGSPERELRVIYAFTVYPWRQEMYNHFLLHSELSITPASSTGTDFVAMLNRYVFVASPIGHGFDVHRTWEALAFGAIPIIQNPATFVENDSAVGRAEENSLMVMASSNSLPDGNTSKERIVQAGALLEVLKDLPVIIVDSPAEITKDSLWKWRRNIFDRAQKGEYKIENLFMQTWMDKIYGHPNEEGT